MRAVLLPALLLSIACSGARAQEKVRVLRVDTTSSLVVGNREPLPIPSGLLVKELNRRSNGDIEVEVYTGMSGVLASGTRVSSIIEQGSAKPVVARSPWSFQAPEPLRIPTDTHPVPWILRYDSFQVWVKDNPENAKKLQTFFEEYERSQDFLTPSRNPR